MDQDWTKERLLTVAEAAQVTRYSAAWFRQAIFARKIGVVRIGRKVFIPESTIRGLGRVVEPRNRTTEQDTP